MAGWGDVTEAGDVTPSGLGDVAPAGDVAWGLLVLHNVGSSSHGLGRGGVVAAAGDAGLTLGVDCAAAGGVVAAAEAAGVTPPHN